MRATIVQITNFYGHTAWHVSIGPHFVGAFMTPTQAEQAAALAIGTSR